MAEQADDLITQLRADILALQEAAAAEVLVVAQATAAAAQAATVATQAAVQQAAAAAGQQGAAVLPGPVFTLAPALANTATFLDLTSSSGAKHFKGAIESLNSHPFDFEDSADLQVFLDLVLTKSQVWGWNNIFNIPVVDPKTAVTPQPLRNGALGFCSVPCFDLLLDPVETSPRFFHAVPMPPWIPSIGLSQGYHCRYDGLSPTSHCGC
jgi:hypothetical protein